MVRISESNKAKQDFIDLIGKEAETLPPAIKATFLLLKEHSEEIGDVRNKVMEVLLVLAAKNETINKGIRLLAKDILKNEGGAEEKLNTNHDPETVKKMTINQLFSKVGEGPLLTRVRTGLSSMGIKTVEDLSKKTQHELYKNKNFGIKSLNLTMDCLRNYGIELIRY
jgi:DNA-directed RNA polymerase alpha subunit